MQMFVEIMVFGFLIQFEYMKTRRRIRFIFLLVLVFRLWYLSNIYDGTFCKNSERLSAVNYLHDRFHLRRFTGFWIRLWRVCSDISEMSWFPVKIYWSKNYLHRKLSFPLRFSYVNVNKSAVFCGFVYIC